MAFLSPLGVYLPRRVNAEEAWGEWGTEAIERCWASSRGNEEDGRSLEGSNS